MKKKKIDLFQNAERVELDYLKSVIGGKDNISFEKDHGDSWYRDQGDSISDDDGDSFQKDYGDSAINDYGDSQF